MKSDRMMIYCWEEVAYPGEYKIGEHWVYDMTLDDAIQHTIAGRIRSSLGVRKDHFHRDNRIKVHFVIDASDYAKKKQKFYPRAKLDAEIHQLINGRVGRGEVFECDYQHIVDVVEKEIGHIDPTKVDSTIKSKEFKRLLMKMKDPDFCVLEQGDPPTIWYPIIDRIPFDLYKKRRPKILVVACCYGTEIKILLDRLTSLGWTDSEIKKSITINDRSDQYTNVWEEAGYKVVVGDFLYLDFGMKFDVILGNPPYQDSTTGNSSKLYFKFFTKCFDSLLVENGYLGFITPRAWLAHLNDTNDQSRNKEMDRMKQVMRSNFLIYVDFNETQRLFQGVGSTFSSYILQKTTEKGLTYVNDFDEYVKVPYLPSLPKDFTAPVFSIFKKIQNRNTIPLIEGGSYSHLGFHSGHPDPNVKRPLKIQTPQHCFPIFHTNSQILYSDIEHPLQNSKKVIASLSGYFEPFYDNGKLGLSQHGVAILVENQNEANNVISILKSKLYQFLLEQTKHNGFTNQYTLKSMPFVSVDKHWSDHELYEHFGLSDQEIKYIEDCIK